MTVTVYSFVDNIATFSHPAVGVYTATGAALNTMSFPYTQDNSALDGSADGSAMISKIQASWGTVALEMQQTSPFHYWLTNYFNFIYNNPSSLVWATARIDVVSLAGLDIIHCTNVAPVKRADRPFGQQGQNVTWNFTVGDMQFAR